MKIVIGIYAKNFHITHGSVISGINTITVVAVHDIKAALYSFTAMSIACLGLNPCFIFSCAHSMTTIVVSIAIPKVTRKLKLVKKFKLSHMLFKTKNVMKKASGSVIVAINDSLNHMNNKRDKNTKISVCVAFLANLL